MKFTNIKYFDSKEFDSPDLPDSGLKMDLDFLEMLDKVRESCGFPFKIDSGYRTLEHNIAVGGEKDSAHMEGKAADIVALSLRTRFLIVSNAIKVGFTRIGIGNTFVHLDNSQANDQQVIWLYSVGKTRK